MFVRRDFDVRVVCVLLEAVAIKLLRHAATEGKARRPNLSVHIRVLFRRNMY